MRILAVSQARFGVQTVIQNVLPRLANRPDVSVTYLTLPIHDAPSGCDRRTLLDEGWLRRLEDTHLPYLAYAVLEFWRRAYHYIDRKHRVYDVVWCHNPRLLPLLDPSIEDRLVVTYHNHLQSRVARERPLPQSAYYRFFGTIERVGIRRLAAAEFTVVGEEIVEELRSVGAHSASYVPNGVDVNRFSPDVDSQTARDRYDLPAGRFLLSLGSLTSQKRPRELLSAYSHAKRNHGLDVPLVVAGTGPDEPALKRFAHSNGLRNVRFLGYVDEELKPALYRAADCFLVASAFDPGGPLTVYEAAASGVSCVASPLPTTAFIKRYDCGRLVDFEDPDKAGEKLADFVHCLTPGHGRNAREYAVDNLSWTDRVDDYFEVLQRVATE